MEFRSFIRCGIVALFALACVTMAMESGPPSPGPDSSQLDLSLGRNSHKRPASEIDSPSLSGNPGQTANPEQSQAKLYKQTDHFRQPPIDQAGPTESRPVRASQWRPPIPPPRSAPGGGTRPQDWRTIGFIEIPASGGHPRVRVIHGNPASSAGPPFHMGAFNLPDGYLEGLRAGIASRVAHTQQNLRPVDQSAMPNIRSVAQGGAPLGSAMGQAASEPRMRPFGQSAPPSRPPVSGQQIRPSTAQPAFTQARPQGVAQLRPNSAQPYSLLNQVFNPLPSSQVGKKPPTPQAIDLYHDLDDYKWKHKDILPANLAVNEYERDMANIKEHSRSLWTL